MADNVAITAGTGTTIAADDVGAGVLVQRVKACLGADGTAVDPIGGAGAVSTAVQRMTLASDDPAVAKLGSFQPRLVQLVPSISVTTIAANDVLAASEIWAAVTSANDVGATLRQLNVTLLDRTAGVGLIIVLLKANVGIAAESAAFSIADADVIHVLDKIVLVAGDFTTNGVSCTATLRNLNIPIIPVTGSDDIYVGIVTVDGTTFGAVTDVVLTGFFE